MFLSVPGSMGNKWYRRAEFLVYFLLLSCFHQRDFDLGTPASRLGLLHGIVSRGSLSINPWIARTSDVAHANGSYFSDKAPGTVLLALPGALAGHMTLK